MSWMQALAFAIGVTIIRLILKQVFGPFYYSGAGYAMVIAIAMGLMALLGFLNSRNKDRLFGKAPVNSDVVFRSIGLIFSLCLMILVLGKTEEVFRSNAVPTFGFTEYMKTHFISALLVAPIVEEFFFQGFLLPSLLIVNGRLRAIIITSTIFMLFHIPWTSNPLKDIYVTEFLAPFITNVVSCLLMIRYNNIWMCVLLHALWNLSNYLIPILIGLSRLPLDRPVVFWVFSFICLIICGILCLQFVKRLEIVRS